MSSHPCDAEAHRQLVERLQSATFVVDGNAVVEANDAALKLVGATRDEVAHLRFNAMFVDGRAPEQLREALVKSRSALHAQLRLRSVGGVEQEISATVTPCAGELAATSMHVIVTQAMVVALGGSAPGDPYAQMFESTAHAMLVIDPETQTILAANRRASELYEFEALPGCPVAAFIGDANSAALTSANSPIEFEIFREDGSAIFLQSTATEIAYRGSPAILAVQRDISTQRQMQTALQQIEERFDLFVNSVTEYALIILDRNGRIESWNSGAERLLGYSAREAIGRQFSIFYTPEDRKAGRPRADLATAASDGSCHYDAWQLRKDHTSFYATVLLTTLKNAAGELVGYIRIVRDSTDRQQLEQEHAALNATLELIAREWVGTFDAIDSAVVLVDDERAIRRLNATARKLANLPFAEILQRRLDDFSHEPWKTAAALADAATRSSTMVSAETRDGQRSWHIEASTAQLEEMSRRIVIVIRETTATRRLEESLRQSELASALGTMIAGVAHELRRPLFQLSSTIDAALARTGETSELQRYAPHLRSSITALNGIIGELLDYTRPQPLRCEMHAPSAVVHEAVRQCSTIAKEKHVTITTDDANAPAKAWYDPARLTQVLQNVVENAIQHTPPDTDVKITVSGQPPSAVQFTVEDEGSGFSADDLERATQPFYTRRHGGTGLGLAIVKKIVDAHRGSLMLSNRPSGGAIVTITLPNA